MRSDFRSMSDNMKASDMTIAAWKMAVRNRPIKQQLLFHSDRGVQYACTDFKEQLKGLPVLQSMSRKGNGPQIRLGLRSVGIMQ
jgi:transposase InsO family protein